MSQVHTTVAGTGGHGAWRSYFYFPKVRHLAPMS
jgi:hypothetical protein